MTRIAISVEGQTEEEFVNRLLAPHLEHFGISLTPIIVATSQTAGGHKHKGGSITVERVVQEVRKILPSSDFVTTLYDFYGFQGRLSGEDVDALTARLGKKIGNRNKFLPYIQLHEFEALLLSSPDHLAGFFGAPKIGQALRAALKAGGGNPEAINDGPTTAPSKRLEKWSRDHSKKSYDGRTKTRFAPPLAEAIGLPRMRAACPRFHQWITELERRGGDKLT